MAAAALTLLLSLASAVAEPVPSAPSLVRRAEAETFALRFQGAVPMLNISIGTPPQHLNVLVGLGEDSSSPSLDIAFNRTRYKQNNSTTFKQSSGGNVTTDAVTIGGVTVNDQLLGNSTSGYDSWMRIHPSGPLFKALSSAWPEPRVGLYMNASDDTTPTAKITFGGLNPDLYTGDLTYVDLVPNKGSPPYIPLQGLKVNGKLVNFTWVGNTTEVNPNKTLPTYGITLSTGWDGILFPDHLSEIFIEKLGLTPVTDSYRTVYTVPCDTQSVLTFTIGGIDFDIQVKDLVRRVDDRCTIRLAPAGGLYEVKGVVYPFLMGHAFLQSVYLAWDFEANKIGFAKASANATEISRVGDKALEDDKPADSGGFAQYPTPSIAFLASLVAAVGVTAFMGAL